ncbi:MAG: endonuclease/exonuclease/phosphatase family protein [Bacteroidaceae bacterium]|nr:endonuclease/exonuclease/phosphatase family protein [Bacteroidaceae bacterium]MBQ8771203.1 endonuclease/exonuclease/phosphatase family protein [Bacteroides sp.]MBR4043321.1 endonuclease/exonuclease/phosphatase family protein [Bacteroidaceae bacterium]
MKKIMFLLLAVCMLAGCSEGEKKVKVRWATFNIRLDTPVDSLNRWGYRMERAAQFIKDAQLDVVGTQEVLHSQFEDLKRMLPEFEGVGVARDDGKTKGEYSSVFYRKDVFDALDSGTFWLSEYPDSVGLKGWDAACVRVATWAKLQHKETGKIVMAVNTHFDHVGVEARKQSALLIIRKIKEIVGDRAAVLTGDFNVTDQSDAYQTITTNEFVLKDAHKIAEKVSGVNYTFHNFTRQPLEKRSKIDFIFVTPHIRVLSSDIPQEVEGALLSDHNPQWIEMEF